MPTKLRHLNDPRDVHMILPRGVLDRNEWRTGKEICSARIGNSPLLPRILFMEDAQLWFEGIPDTEFTFLLNETFI
jgi:hypothetical protein